MKQNNNTGVFVFFVIAFFGVLVISGCTANNNTTSTGEGRFVVTMTDAAANMGSVSEIRMTIDNIKVYSKTDGWITLESKSQTYSLLELNAQSRAELMTDSKVNIDEFTQVKLNIKNVVVVDTQGEHEAKLPSQEYTVNINSKVEANQTSTVEFDVLASESLHVTGNGEYIMAPVANVEIRSNADVQVKSDNAVIISGGETTIKTAVGMDVNGDVGVGLKIPADVKLEITTGVLGGEVRISTGSLVSTNGASVNSTGKLIIGITDAAANMGSVSKVRMTVDSIEAHSKTGGWVTLSTTDKQYELLKLKSEGKIELVTDAEVDSGAYDQIRMDIKNIVVVDTQGEHEAKLPSGEIQIMNNFTVDTNSNTAITFDFIADESLHVTGEGSYIMAPVINLGTIERATVDLQGENGIIVQGGQKSEIKVGMDINGNVGIGNIISSTANLKLSSSGTVSII